MWIHSNEKHAGEQDLLTRCPIRAVKSDQDRIWRKHMVRACQDRDPSTFFEAFFSSQAAQRSALSKRIVIIRGDLGEKIWPRKYYRPRPIAWIANRGYFDNGNDQTAPLNLDFIALLNNGLCLDWTNKLHGNENKMTIAPQMRGRLTFEYEEGCWKLVADAIRWTEWP
jgi:hypothetical protein